MNITSNTINPVNNIIKDDTVNFTAADKASSGIFITFEGVDGSGKSTQCALFCQALKAAGKHIRFLREPGGTELGEGIRRLLLDPTALDEGVKMSDACELLLYEAARAQLVEQVIQPALVKGEVVVSDRFCDSTLAYQGVARGLGFDVVNSLNKLVCSDTFPNRTLVLDLDPAAALARATDDHEPDRLEGEGAEFERKVRSGYARIAAMDPDRVRLIDATGTIEQVYDLIRSSVQDLVTLPDYQTVITYEHNHQSC